MHRNKFFRGLLFLVFAVLAVTAAPVYGQAKPSLDPHHLDGAIMGRPINLTGQWLLKQGDDPRYADPNLDDGQWMVVQAGKKLSSYGLQDVDKVWYRTHVKVAAGRKDLALMMRQFGGSFDLFVNGVQVGTSGPHPEGGSGVPNYDESFSIPAELTASGDLTIAVRATVARRSQGGTAEAGFASYTVLLLGPAATLKDLTTLYTFRSYTSNALNIVLDLMVPLLALALAVTLKKEREYMALAISGAASFVMDLITVWQTTTNHFVSLPLFFVNGLLNSIAIIALLEFVRIVLGLRRSRWWVGYEALLVFSIMVVGPYANYSLLLGSGGLQGSFLLMANIVAMILGLPVNAGLPILALAVWWRRRNPDALLLFVPLFLQALINYVQFTFLVLNSLHITERTGLPRVPVTTFFLQWSEVTSFLFSVALLLFLVLRTVRIARSRAAMASDLHAVQSVQEILLARASHPTPGFRVEHVYFPASEVGGDFFLVSPGPDGSLTAIVGDVSGKGLVAAMRVSMILGVLRREEKREPEAILRNLNEALMMQGEMGFTTACCVRLEANGRYTIANAGHISPYVGGVEIDTPSSLPLGMSEIQEYEQVVGFLPEGKTLVLMSDGVVEARAKSGELYGFDRLPQLTLMAAHDIADVARRFGQEDDITVLTVACGV